MKLRQGLKLFHVRSAVLTSDNVPHVSCRFEAELAASVLKVIAQRTYEHRYRHVLP